MNRESKTTPVILLTTVFSLTLSVWSSSAFAEVRHVPADYPTIQSCIDAADSGDDCIVAPGTYNEVINFLGKAITLRSSDGAGVTIIDGSGLNNSVIKCINGEGLDTILSGFTITGGNALRGGGMLIVNSEPRIRRLLFYNNVAISGAGICSINRSSAIITLCTFRDNKASDRGGGMCNTLGSNPNIIKCIFSNNEARVGAGIFNESNSSPLINWSKFFYNKAADSGGGIFNNFQCNPIIEFGVFLGNSAFHNGGAINNARSNAKLINSIFLNNNASQGGAIFNVGESNGPIINSIINNNVAFLNGGGIYNDKSSPKLINCVLMNNIAGKGSVIYNRLNSFPTIENCIVWPVDDDFISDDPTTETTVSFSDIVGGLPKAVIDYGGNINTDPMFRRNPSDGGDGWGDDPETPDVDESANDDFGYFILKPGSPCIDAGNNEAVPKDIITDLYELPRFVNDFAIEPDPGFGNAPIVDMGAYEYQVDCNHNQIKDDIDIATDQSDDCNNNGYPDECEESDTDSDGLIDECDTCPESQTNETIIINGCDTNVANIIFDDGCTMADVLAECQSGIRLHDSGKNISCTVDLASGWLRRRLITGQEFSQIVTCAANSNNLRHQANTNSNSLRQRQ